MALCCENILCKYKCKCACRLIINNTLQICTFPFLTPFGFLVRILEVHSCEAVGYIFHTTHTPLRQKRAWSGIPAVLKSKTNLNEKINESLNSVEWTLVFGVKVYEDWELFWGCWLLLIILIRNIQPRRKLYILGGLNLKSFHMIATVFSLSIYFLQIIQTRKYWYLPSVPWP